MDIFGKLHLIRATGGKRKTLGLPDDVLARFESDPALGRAVDDAVASHAALSAEFSEVMAMDESEQVAAVTAHLVNFYADDAVNPYVAIGGCGPWVVTAKGAVVHDSGGYGMMGFGHAPEPVLEAMARRQVMANVMTASFSHLRVSRALEREIGHTRGACPFARFIFMNSGSESVTVGTRIVDINTRTMTGTGGRHAGKPVRIASLTSSFHGRTDRPARFSDSTLKTYSKYLASFRDFNELLTVRPNDVDGLRALFERADREGFFIEALFMEPVMGEGNPGYGLESEFYDVARELTRSHGSLLLIDSIQAGLRAHGVLSIIDYPGFEKSEAPDMETYSKALNAGQFPLSVLALTRDAAGIYKKGVYGNTMTANPRGLDIACTVLDGLTPDLRRNIRDRGAEFIVRFEELASELNGPITGVQGTGLLFSCELDPRFRCSGAGSTEEYMRIHGIGVIHGGRNSLRFTPHFAITSAEVQLIVEATRDALINGPREDVDAPELRQAAAR